MSRASHLGVLLGVLLLLSGCPSGDADDDTSAGDDDTTGPGDDDSAVTDLDGDGFTSEEGDCDDTDPTAYLGAEELCDGTDNDCDGEVDEGFGDVDGDGLDDCQDDSCDVALPVNAYVEIDHACADPAPTPTPDPWDVVVEWQYDMESCCRGTNTMPVVGQLTDDDGNGRIDALDIPDIVLVADNWSTLFALSGDGSGEHFVSETGYWPYSTPVIADVDQDGTPEVVAVDLDFLVVALGPGGGVEWRSTMAGGNYGFGQPMVADLEGDGDVEIVSYEWINEGADGALQATLGNTFGDRWSTAADLDADGVLEIVYANEGVFGPLGLRLWRMECPPDTPNAIAVVDIDGDGLGEVLEACATELFVLDQDGTLLDTWTLPTVHLSSIEPGPMAVADFDGDGASEVAVPVNDTLSLLELDGSVLWTFPISDATGYSGCLGADLDSNGVPEVLYVDEGALYILDGPTGSVLYEWDGRCSETGHDYPVVADVDADGSAEILVVNDSFNYSCEFQGLTVLGHAANGWAVGPRTWALHDHAPGRIDDNGHVPTPAPLPWRIENVYRAWTSVPYLADVEPFVEEYCIASCVHGPVDISYGLMNHGAANAVDVQVGLYAVEGDELTLLDTQTVAGVAAGISQAGGTFSMPLEDWIDGFAVGVEVAPEGGGDCDETNDVVVVLDDACGS